MERQGSLVGRPALPSSKEVSMPTADTVREKALALADAGPATEEAVEELFDYCEAKRVPVVLARQQLLKDLEARPSDPVVTGAAELLDQVLGRLPLE
jgi:hypothetical protein